MSEAALRNNLIGFYLPQLADAEKKILKLLDVLRLAQMAGVDLGDLPQRIKKAYTDYRSYSLARVRGGPVMTARCEAELLIDLASELEAKIAKRFPKILEKAAEESSKLPILDLSKVREIAGGGQ